MEKDSEIRVALLWKSTIIIYMNADCDIQMNEKQIANLKAWKRWGMMMKLLRAIHVEIAPLKQKNRSAFESL